ncbi:6-phosphogluconolactonase [Campylobacter sp.]|uniref:6-phosphogluconolactonase n=1 Tax=Campylobacter sp. TaxID=205 RepID=UPI0026DBB11F|nr:6-phosphogluconolactonase [Campylobacter sp.]MDO4674770.1 6-phosphogluconolactonase [Campylobacter sp.]
MSFALYSFATQELCNKALTSALLTQIKELLALKNKVVLALSGGRSPRDFLQLLSEQECQWHKCVINLVDERVVDVEHEDSNAAFIQKYFLQNSAQAARFIPLLEEANDDLEFLLKNANANFIQPDFAVLGMGLDGHTASLFSDAKEFDHALRTQENIVAISPKNAPHKRLSLSLSALEKCKKLFLLIGGEDKAKVFQKVIKNVQPTHPVSYILHSRKVPCDVYFHD